MTRPAKDEPETTPQLSQGVRTFITFLLFLHCFALGVTVLYHTGAASGLQQALFSRIRTSYYVDLLGLDLNYDLHLTHNTGADFDHVCDVVLDTPQGFRGDDEQIARQSLKTIELMPESTWPGARRRRLLGLGLRVYVTAEQEEVASNIPQALAEGLLAQNNITEGKHQFRCRVLEPRHWEEPGSEMDPRDPRLYRDVYRADVISAGPGEWSLVKVVSEAETTQSQDGSSNNSTAPQSSNQGGSQ